MNFKRRFSRRNFISLSSLGMAAGITNFGDSKLEEKIRLFGNFVKDTLPIDNYPDKNRVLHLHPLDNVAVALENLTRGTKVTIDNMPFILEGPISIKHKFTLTDIATGNPIYLYGIKVGVAIRPISKGTAVTTENIINAVSEIDTNVSGKFNWTPPQVEAFRNKIFMGYHRQDGRVGTANYWLVIPMVFCENRNIEIIKEAIISELGYQQVSPYQKFTRDLISHYKKSTSLNDKGETENANNRSNPDEKRVFRNVNGVRFLVHDMGCGGTRQDAQALCGILAGYITHPNVAGATVLSLGCQHAQLSILQDEIRKRDSGFSKPYFEFEQQKIGTEDQMIRMAIESIFKGLEIANQFERKPAPVSKLCIGLKCGGSDGFSGISANPAIGHVSDMIVSLGGSSVLSEFPELSGVEQDLYYRCNSKTDADRFLNLMRTYNEKAKSVGSGFEMNPSPGNIRDGLITDAMKSAGAAKKGGTSPVTGVSDYPNLLAGSGLNLLCTPGNDVESVTAQAGSGANVVLFTTGLGTPTGNPIVPVIKVSTNTALSLKMPDIIDIDSGTIIEGKETIEQVAERILDYVIEVASGLKEPAAVRNDQVDFIPWKRGVSL
jgi:altronate hydrolase